MNAPTRSKPEMPARRPSHARAKPFARALRVNRRYESNTRTARTKEECCRAEGPSRQRSGQAGTERRVPTSKNGIGRQIADCLYSCARGTDGPPLLKAFAAVHRTTLRRLEGNCRFLPALRADSLGFHALDAAPVAVGALGSIRLAGLAPLGLVLEALVGEKHLLTGGEDKLRPALGAFQDLVMVFHTLLRGRVRTEEPASGRAPRQRASGRADIGGLLGRWHETAEETPVDEVA